MPTEKEKKIAALRQQLARDSSNNIRRLREEAGLGQAELAEMVGVHRLTILRIETGAFRLNFDDACLIADALGVNVAELRVPRIRD